MENLKKYIQEVNHLSPIHTQLSGWQYLPPALTEANPDVAFLCETVHDDRITILEESPFATIGHMQGFLTIPGKFQ